MRSTKAALLAAGVAETCCYPLDSVKTFLQVGVVGSSASSRARTGGGGGVGGSGGNGSIAIVRRVLARDGVACWRNENRTMMMMMMVMMMMML